MNEGVEKIYLLRKKIYIILIRFGGGSGKNLTIDQVYNILMTLKHTGSWIEAFKYIP